jgi:3-deoxy-manno-octulosonate cytidylyltransferase (CMP-KDO synthetase)|tara:strand:+ start:3021 stop:3794 length:774 start_codon:yes stop_codon:yes gene_type:complete
MKIETSDILGVIPARFNSTRLLGKPLKLIGDKPMIQHVYERTKKTLNNVIVATDDDRIFNCIKDFGGKVILTKENHENGTSRCLEAVNIYRDETGTEYKYIVNIQGDEPLIHEDHLKKLILCFRDPNTNFATVALQLSNLKHLPNGKVFLVKDINDNALYFSRNIIPFIRDNITENINNNIFFYQHIGIYGYAKESLEKFCKQEPSSLEKSEKLEQLRWLENGGKIKVGITKQLSYPVDTIEDLNEVRKIYEKKHHI